MTSPQETSRRVSISALPKIKVSNGQTGQINARQLTPFAHRIPNSFLSIGQTPHNSYAQGCDGGAASPRHIGNLPQGQAGTGPLQASLVAHRLKALRNVRGLKDQENSSGEDSPEASLSYRAKLLSAPSSVKHITENLAKQKLDQDGVQRHPLSFAKDQDKLDTARPLRASYASSCRRLNVAPIPKSFEGSFNSHHPPLARGKTFPLMNGPDC